MHYDVQAPVEDEAWLEDIPIDLLRSSGIRVVVVLREYLDPHNDPAVEVERVRLRCHYQSNGIPVYPTAERAFRALCHVVTYNERRRGL
jgi:hypothetical protein